MPKKIHYVEVGKIYRPKTVVPRDSTNIITNNITTDRITSYNVCYTKLLRT